MPKLRRLSCDEVIAILGRHGFRIHSQRGSHIKLRQQVASGHQSLTVPRHDPLPVGTLHAIFIQATRFIPEPDLRKDFYSD